MKALLPVPNMTRLVMLLAVILFAAFFSLAQEQSTATVAAPPATLSATAGQAKVFVFVQRSARHVKYSHSEDFHNAMNDLLDYLKSKNVAIAVDEFGGRNSAEASTPMETVMNIARDAKASGLLYVEVDRPLSKWIKITVQCMDLGGKQLWQEEASSGGGLSGAHGLEVTTKKLHAALDKHLGQQGLPILVAQEPAAQKP
jgi:hypothetical protein